MPKVRRCLRFMSEATPTGQASSERVAAARTPDAGSTIRPREPVPLLTQRDLAKRWGNSGRTLERWRVNGIGPEYLRLNGRVRYRLDAVLAFEEACRRRSTSDSANPASGLRR